MELVLPRLATFIPKARPIIPGAMSITAKATLIMPMPPLELLMPPAIVITSTATPTSTTGYRTVRQLIKSGRERSTACLELYISSSSIEEEEVADFL